MACLLVIVDCRFPSDSADPYENCRGSIGPRDVFPVFPEGYATSRIEHPERTVETARRQFCYRIVHIVTEWRPLRLRGLAAKVEPSTRILQGESFKGQARAVVRRTNNHRSVRIIGIQRRPDSRSGSDRPRSRAPRSSGCRLRSRRRPDIESSAVVPERSEP
jgi:hypothetical protein